MAMYETSPSGKQGVTHGTEGQCQCGKPAETEVQIGWIPEANAGAGGGQYDEVCWACRDEDDSRLVIAANSFPAHGGRRE